MLIEVLVAIKPTASSKGRLLIWADPNDVMVGRGRIHDLLDIVLARLRVEGVNVLFYLRVKDWHRQAWHIINRLGKTEPMSFALCIQNAIHQIKAGFGANETVKTFGQIDAVFANTGIARIAPFISISEEDWTKVIDVNVNGVWRTLKAATPHLLSSKGYVLVTSSAAASICLPLGAHYTASKAAALNLAEAYRTEMYGFGIEVGTLHPMFVKTAMVKDAIWGNDYGRRLAQQSKVMFLNFPLNWVAKKAAKMILRRKRRATVPAVHLPIIWFPRAANNLVNLIAFRRKGMRALMRDVAGAELGKASRCDPN